MKKADIESECEKLVYLPGKQDYTQSLWARIFVSRGFLLRQFLFWLGVSLGASGKVGPGVIGNKLCQAEYILGYLYVPNV